MSSTDWTFGGSWPYEPRWFDSADGRMHYVDEGRRDGRPVVMVHGNPTWAYLYRNFIGPLTAAGYRAIAIDHLGFGRSEKPDDPALYTIARHVERADALLESLDLSERDAGHPGLGRPDRARLGDPPPGADPLADDPQHLRPPPAGEGQAAGSAGRLPACRSSAR